MAPHQSFTHLPAPFRVVVLISAEILAWASNIHGLERAGIDVHDLLELSGVPSYTNIYRLHVVSASWIGACWALFYFLTQGLQTVQVY